MNRRTRRALAWGVHFYTALGLACAAGVAVLIVEGTDAAFRQAFWLLALATLIDATDGTLARAIHIKEVLPRFDGRRLDDLIDFLTYTSLPLLLVWRAKLLPEGAEAVLLLALFASAYGFCQVEAKTADGYFLGFPSYWNLVALYLYLLRPWPGWLSVGTVVTLSALTFVPWRYLYPSQRGRLNFWTNLLAAPWAALLAASLWLAGEDREAGRLFALGSLYYPAWYFAASWVVSARHLLRSSAKLPPRGALPREERRAEHG